jgi:hypothetical protein
VRRAERRALVFVTGVVIVGGVYVVVSATLSFFGWPLGKTAPQTVGVSDTVAIEGDIISGATFVLAIVAGILALAAYVVSVRAPRLAVRAWGWGKYTKRRKNHSLRHEEWLQLTLVPGSDAYASLAATESQIAATVVLHNSSRNPAKTPALRLRFDGVRGTIPVARPWEVVEHPDDRSEAYQWAAIDGAIHGGWSLTLPSLDMRKVTVKRSGASIKWELVAEDWSSKGVLPVRCS